MQAGGREKKNKVLKERETERERETVREREREREREQLGVVAHTFNPSTWKAETGGSL